MQNKGARWRSVLCAGLCVFTANAVHAAAVDAEAMAKLSLNDSADTWVTLRNPGGDQLFSKDIAASDALYPSMGYPNVPVLHPYNPLDPEDAAGQISAQVFVATHLPKAHIPKDIQAALEGRGVKLEHAQHYFTISHAPWSTKRPLLHRPHAWFMVHAGYKPTFNVKYLAGVYPAPAGGEIQPQLGGAKRTLQEASAHVHEGGNNQEGKYWVASPNAPQLQGAPLNAESAFYSVTVDQKTQKAAVVLHGLVPTQQDGRMADVARGLDGKTLHDLPAALAESGFTTISAALQSALGEARADA